MEIGEYCRTKDGDLGIIESINNDYINLTLNNDLGRCIPKEKILIHNKDLFYVLFPGDYINGNEGGRVKAKVSDKLGNYFLVGHNGIFFANDIKSVITKEKYKVMQELKEKARELRQKEKEIKQQKEDLKKETKEFEENSIFVLREEK